MPAPADLTPAEQALIEHVERGELLDLDSDESQPIRAEVIRDIMRGRLAPAPDPRGLLLAAARIEGRLDLRNVSSPVVLKLIACLLDEGLDVSGAQLVALDLSGCTLSSSTGPALNAEGLRTERDLYLRGEFEATGAGGRGAVCLLNATIGGQLDAGTAQLRNDSGPALLAEHLRVDHGLFLNGLQATGTGDLGTLYLVDARVAHLELDGAALRNDSGPALLADDLHVDRSLHMRAGFQATGTGESGAVRLLGAHIGGQVDATGARLRNDTGSALDLERMRVGENAFLRHGFEAVGGGDDVTLQLTDLCLEGALIIEGLSVDHLGAPNRQLDVDGLTYGEAPRGVTTGEWLGLLREGTPTYRPQPYQQLATVLRATGHDSEARRVLMHQRRDQLARGSLNRADRTWARVTGLTLGYGYQPWRALLALLGVIAVSAVLAVVLGGHGALVQARSACPVIDQVGIGLDLGTPLISTGSSARCQLTSSATGQALTLTGWLLRLLAWAFATLFVAGFTNAVRKT